MLMELAETPQYKPHQSLGRWMLVGMSALLLTTGACFLFFAHQLMEARFDSFDAKHYEQELMRVNGVFKQSRQSFELLLTDYAHWDDTEQFTLGSNPEFIQENLVPESLINIQVDGFIITHLDGSLVTEPHLVIDNELVLMPESIWHTFSALLPSLMTPDKLSANTALAWVGTDAIMITGSTITDTIKSHDPSGYLFFIRKLDSKILQGFKNVTQVDFELLPAPISQNAQVETHTLIVNDEPHWRVDKNLAGLPAKIKVQGGTFLEEERNLTLLLLALSVAGLSLISLLGVYWILNFKVLKRIRLFSTLADQHRQAPEQNIHWPVVGKDELDNLAISLNEFISEVGKRHDDLSYLAEHDALTGLGNRRLLMSRLDANMNHNKRNPSFISTLLLLDLDGFKLLNDGLGHSAGDDILRLVAQRMLAIVRNYDTVVRLGGDEFAILLENVEPEMVLPFAERLHQHIHESFEYNGHKLKLKASIGLAAVKSALAKEDVIRNADLAMYEAKRKGRNQTVLFRVDLLDAVSRRLQLEQALQEALNHQELEVWFQPIVDARNGEVVAMEALSRWFLDGIFVPPDEFIDIAEASGMITKLGKQVFDNVGASLADLRLNYPELICNVNLSVRQFRDSNLEEDIVECATKYQLPSSAIHLELTESMIATSETEILPTMRALVDKGYKFHLDDFGTGYSSLERLRNLPFDTLKVDRSFITPLGKGDDVMVRNIINIGNELGMSLIAEGVETETEVHKLLQLGCWDIQGYYFARPMPLAKLKLWLAENQAQIAQQTFTQQKHTQGYII
jgi:diguanylate cyclase (GGDEF)-like protein